MLSEADRKKAADILMAAQKERKQAVQLHVTFPDITIEDSYAISTDVMQRKVRAGAKLIGHKVGLTSKAMQRSSMIDEPDYGYILDDQLIADGAKVKHADYCKPRVEVELAFIMGKRLQGPGVGLTDVLRATEYVVPAIEIVDARIQDPRKIVDTVADNGAAAGIAMGGRPVGPLDVDLRWVGGIMSRNSEIEETGLAAGVLGHPALGVAWLANKIGPHGHALEPGHIVLAGSFTRVVFAQKGDTLHADFRDSEGLQRIAAESYADGFAGMLAIHPSQVPVINAAFTPGEAEIAEARAIVNAFSANPGAGTLSLDGRMIDQPHLEQARRLLERLR